MKIIRGGADMDQRKFMPPFIVAPDKAEAFFEMMKNPSITAAEVVARGKEKRRKLMERSGKKWKEEDEQSRDYELNLKTEALREKSSGILADFNRYMEENNIPWDSADPIAFLRKSVLYIQCNICKPEFNSMEKLNEANGKLDLAVEILEKMSKEDLS